MEVRAELVSLESEPSSENSNTASSSPAGSRRGNDMDILPCNYAADKA
jgi:hypothetical protein